MKYRRYTVKVISAKSHQVFDKAELTISHHCAVRAPNFDQPSTPASLVKNKHSKISDGRTLKEVLLSPSGDLGIGLV